MSIPDELRQAATSMREQHGPGHPRHAMWVALAEWLEAAAIDEQFYARNRHSTFGYKGENPGLTVARAYMKALT